MRNSTVTSAALAAALVFASCGGGSGTTADDASPVKTEVTEAAATTEAPAEATEPEEASSEDSDEAAGLAVGRTGPIRELPGLSEWADMDLDPFLREVMNYPEEVPVANNAVLTWINVTQYFDDDGIPDVLRSDSTYEPMFTMDEFRTIVPAMVDGAGWGEPDVSEDAEAGSLSMTYYADDTEQSVSELYFTYTDADSDTPPELRISSFGRQTGGPVLAVNDALFPWVNDIVTDPAMVPTLFAFDIGRLEGKAEFDYRWDAQVGDFDRLTDFYRTPTGTDFTAAGEMVFSDSPWPTNDIDVVRPDGFEGEISVYETDPEDETSVIIGGWYILE